MSLIDQWGNRTITERLERQAEREMAFVGILDDVGLNRQQRRALRKARFVRTRSKRDIKREYKGREDELQRLVAFFGPDHFFKRESLAMLKFGKGAKSLWRTQPLNEDETRRLKKATRKHRKAKP